MELALIESAWLRAERPGMSQSQFRVFTVNSLRRAKNPRDISDCLERRKQRGSPRQLMAESKTGFRENRCGIRRDVRFDGPSLGFGRACVDALELTVVARTVQAHKEGIAEADCRGEAEKSCDEKKNLLYGKWLDAD